MTVTSLLRTAVLIGAAAVFPLALSADQAQSNIIFEKDRVSVVGAGNGALLPFDRNNGKWVSVTSQPNGYTGPRNSVLRAAEQNGRMLRLASRSLNRNLGGAGGAGHV